MLNFKNCITLFFCFMLSSVILGQEKENWMTDFQKSGANFFEIQQKYQKRFVEKENTKIVEIFSKSKNVKIVGENDFIKFRRWEWYMSHNIHSDGSLPTSSELYQAYEDVSDKVIQKSASTKIAANWINISRTSNSGGYWGMGRTRGIGFHPTDSNIFWVCAESGGIWKTTNGGASYVAQGDNLPYLGSGSIVVDHSDGNTVYIATGDNAGGNSAGIYKSINGGSSWFATGFTNNLSDNVKVYSLLQSPTNASILLAATNRGLYRTTDSGSNWTLVISGNTTDAKFGVSEGNDVYAIIGGKFYRSTNAGVSFAQVSGSPNLGTRGELSVSTSDTDKILIWSNAGIWTSNDRGDTWSAKNKAEGSVNFDSMLISPNNPTILYGGAIDMWRSDNDGSSWTKISNWYNNNNPSTPEVHADHRMLAYNPLNNLIYSCNDGGIDRYTESSKTWVELNNGLQVPQYYSAASSETDGNIIGVGSQDNGGSRRLSNGTWVNTNGGDAGTQAIDPTDPDISYSNYNPRPAIIRTTNGWGSTTDIKPNENVTSWWVIPYTLQPSEPKNIIVGYHAIYKSYDRGDSWTKISPDFAPRNDYWKAFRAVAVAPSNGNVIYAARPGKFHYTYDNGGSWGELNFSQDITDIEVDPADSNIVYVTCGRYDNGQKVYKSIDGGKNWTNISSGLPNIPVYSITYQKDSDELLYIGTQLGVFYKNKTMNTWAVYGSGLPKTMVRDVHINYNQQKLRAATYGRGIYETSLATNPVDNVCSSPQNVKTTELTSKSVELSWDAIPGAKRYYTYHKSGSSAWQFTEANANTTVIIDNLTPNTLYTVDVWVQCANDETKSTRITITTPEENVCTSPQNVKINEITSNSVTINWDALPGAKQYYTYHIGGGLSWTLTQVALNTSATITNLQPNTSYTIDVWLQCANNEYKSTRIQATTLSEDPVESGSTYEIVSTLPKKRTLEVYGSGKRDEANVVLWWAYNGTSNRWIFNKLSNGYYVISPLHDSTRALDVYQGKNSNGTNVQTYSKNNGNSQQWKLIAMGNDMYKIESVAAPGKYLSVSAGVDQDGTNIIIWQNTGKNSQIWKFNLENNSKNLDPSLSSRDQTLVSPIPAVEEFTIDFKNTSDSKFGGKYIELINILGKVVKKIKISNAAAESSVNVSTQELVPGAYILRIKNENGTHVHSQQIIIRR